MGEGRGVLWGSVVGEGRGVLWVRVGECFG